MPPISLPAVVAGGIDALQTGTVVLGVPLLGDVIQIGTAERLPAGAIDVRRTPSTLTVRRTDGTPLQAQIVRRGPNGAECRTTVFTDPVAALGIRRFRAVGDSWLWTVTLGANVRYQPDLAQLIATVVAFGLVKQRSTTSRPIALSA